MTVDIYTSDAVKIAESKLNVHDKHDMVQSFNKKRLEK